MQPTLAWPTIGICKDQNFELLGKLLHRDAQIVYLFATIFGLSCDQYGGFYTGSCRDTLYNAVSGIAL